MRLNGHRPPKISYNQDDEDEGRRPRSKLKPVQLQAPSLGPTCHQGWQDEGLFLKRARGVPVGAAKREKGPPVTRAGAGGSRAHHRGNRQTYGTALDNGKCTCTRCTTSRSAGHGPRPVPLRRWLRARRSASACTCIWNPDLEFSWPPRPAIPQSSVLLNSTRAPCQM